MVNFLIEALAVGFLSMILGTLLSVGFMYLQPSFSLKTINFWPSLLLTNFLTGFIIHFMCEVTGLNAWYCRHGYACSK